MTPLSVEHVGLSITVSDELEAIGLHVPVNISCLRANPLLDVKDCRQPVGFWVRVVSTLFKNGQKSWKAKQFVLNIRHLTALAANDQYHTVLFPGQACRCTIMIMVNGWQTHPQRYGHLFFSTLGQSFQTVHRCPRGCGRLEGSSHVPACREEAVLVFSSPKSYKHKGLNMAVASRGGGEGQGGPLHPSNSTWLYWRSSVR